MVGVEKAHHGFLVAAEDDSDVSLRLVGEDVHEHVEDHASRIPLVLAVEEIGLVDHQHAAACHLDDLLGCSLFVAPECADEGAAVTDDDVSAGEGSGLAEQRAVDAADGCLACSGSAEEEAVEGDGVLPGLWEVAAHESVEGGEGHEVVHAALDVCASDEVLQLLAWIGDGADDLDLDGEVLVLLDFAGGEEGERGIGVFGGIRGLRGLRVFGVIGIIGEV